MNRTVEPACLDATKGVEEPLVAAGCGDLVTVFATMDGGSRLETVSCLQVKGATAATVGYCMYWFSS